jgi:hypothetical protein
MRLRSIYKTVEQMAPPMPEQVAHMGKLIEEVMKGGTSLATEGCLPSVMGERARLSRGQLTATEGPFTETKELVAGFALLQAKSKAEAIELTKRFLTYVGGDGECEVRQLCESMESDCAGPRFADSS